MCDGKATVVHGYLVFVLFILAIPLSRLTAIGFAQVDEQTLDFLTSSQVIAPIAGIMLFLISVSSMAINTRETRILLAATAANRIDEGMTPTSASARLSCAQVGVANSSALYGSFAFLPIVLAWLYISWQIILMGSVLSCQLQTAFSPKESGQ